MSEAFEIIIDRAIKDEEYRNLLLSEPDKALEGYDLSDEEWNLLQGLDKDTLDDFAGRLGDRNTT